ncbi:MAG: type II secretion system protein [Candidatus Roizmanbacteria bacterium]
MKKGFTLVELLVVASIISMLAVVGIASFITLTQQSRDVRRKADIEQIRSALEMYKNANPANTYPPSVSVGCSATNSPIQFTTVYLQTIPKDPKCSTREYRYVTSTDLSDYSLGVAIESKDNSSTTCGTCGSFNCNYCVGPTGERP